MAPNARAPEGAIRDGNGWPKSGDMDPRSRPDPVRQDIARDGTLLLTATATTRLGYDSRADASATAAREQAMNAATETTIRLLYRSEDGTIEDGQRDCSIAEFAGVLPSIGDQILDPGVLSGLPRSELATAAY